MQSRLIPPLALLLAASTLSAQARVVERVRTNDNRARAGIFGNGVLAIRLEARMAEWHPQGDDAPGAMIPVFAEIGRSAQVPGPLIRVPGGTQVIAVVRNAIPNVTLTIHGLHSRPVIGALFNDSIQLAPGQVQTLRFKLDRPGTYYYWATTTGRDFFNRTKEDAQLTGAIVVDDPSERQPKDRIFVIGMWADTTGTPLSRHRLRELFVMNGKSWPYTDRLQYEKGEVVRWRVINGSADPHPMHLHGFYYRVLRRGDGKADTVFGSKGDLVNTEFMAPGETMLVSWTADRLGNWLFHCHIPDHFAMRGPLGFPPAVTLTQAGSMHMPAASMMGGLVTAIEIKPAEDDTTANLPPPPIPEPARRLRLVLRPNAGTTALTPYYGIALQEALSPEPLPDTGQRIGPPIVLTKGEPVSIMVVNRVPEATSIHWHGIELDSYYDGVPGFSGVKPQLAPIIAPNDSFEVRITPPRSGTFIYHTHMNEARQQGAGLAGALIVAEKGKYDTTRNIPIVISSPSDSVQEESIVLLNGSAAPAPLELKRATTYRLRLINITTRRPGLRLELKEDSTTQTWRTVSKDGADIPVANRTLRPARQALSIGETIDVELFTARVGDFKLEAQTQAGVPLGALPIRIR